MISSWEKYKEKIPIAEEIYDELFNKPKTHHEWAEGFNIRHRIIRILQKNNNHGKENT